MGLKHFAVMFAVALFAIYVSNHVNIVKNITG